MPRYVVSKKEVHFHSVVVEASCPLRARQKVNKGVGEGYVGSSFLGLLSIFSVFDIQAIWRYYQAL